MATLVAGVALIITGLAGITFRRVFASAARLSDFRGAVDRVMPFMRWRGWLPFELFLIAAGIAVLIYGAK